MDRYRKISTNWSFLIYLLLDTAPTPSGPDFPRTEQGKNMNGKLSLTTLGWLLTAPLLASCAKDTDSSNTDDTNVASDSGTPEDTDTNEPEDTDTDEPEDTDTDEPADTDTEDTGETTELQGDYSGNLYLDITTKYGPDSCQGNIALTLDEQAAVSVTGSGTCKFGILGNQLPVITGELDPSSGTVSGILEMEAFGTPFSLDWDGVYDASSITVSTAGPSTISSIGDIEYSVEFEAVLENKPAGNITDYTKSGTFSGSVNSGTFDTTGGCTLKYKTYIPNQPQTSGSVVMMHGFLRNLDRYSAWADHLSSWGIPTVTVTMCHSSVIDVNPDENAADVQELMDSLGMSNTLYVGHSNGAISAIQAAYEDTNSLGAFGLDPVESFGADHTAIAAALNVPAYALMGEPTSCNSDNNGQIVYESAPNNMLLSITEAGHCDFENPTNVLCELAPGCDGSNTLFSEEEIQSTIVGLTTAFLRWKLYGDNDGKEWWTSGAPAYEALLQKGAILPL